MFDNPFTVGTNSTSTRWNIATYSDLFTEIRILLWLYDILGWEIQLIVYFFFIGHFVYGPKRWFNKKTKNPDNEVIQNMKKECDSRNYDGVMNIRHKVYQMNWPAFQIVLRAIILSERDIISELKSILNQHQHLCTSDFAHRAMDEVGSIVRNSGTSGSYTESTTSLSRKTFLAQLLIAKAFSMFGTKLDEAPYRNLFRHIEREGFFHCGDDLLKKHPCGAKLSLFIEHVDPSSRMWAGFLKMALKMKKMMTALCLTKAMKDAHVPVPIPVANLLIKLACDGYCASDVYEILGDDIEYSAEAYGALIDWGYKQARVAFVKKIYARVKHENKGMTYSVFDSLIKMYASQGDSCAVDLFQDMIREFTISDGSLVSFITTCAESKFVQLAEMVLDHCKQRGKPSLAMFSALMKVYSHARLFHKTCDVYESMLEANLEPDTVAFGCLIKAAVECGRSGLARKLFLQSGNPDLLNYMSLIRAAGREKNMSKALDILTEMEQSRMPMDTTCYNCVLDVCVMCAGWQQVEHLFSRMKVLGKMDVISFNTYMKAFAARNLWGKVEDTLHEMQSREISPNAVTFNSLINAAIANRDMTMAWRFLRKMEDFKVNVDAYTCSIMIKGLKHGSQKADVDDIFALIERSHVVPDEVLVNGLLDACVRLRDAKRLSQAVEQFTQLGVVPSMHAYTVLMKSYGHLRRMDKVWDTWEEMTIVRGISPDEAMYGCVIDACVFNGELNCAKKMFWEMKSKYSFYKNTHTASNLIRGFAQRKDLKQAMALYEETRQDNVTVNVLAYNILIDCCARAGNMETAFRLFQDMSQSDVAPDLITYSTVIKGFCLNGDLDRGLQIFNIMRLRGIQPDAILFNSILDGCARKHMRSLTEEVFADMERSNTIVVSNFTLSILIKMYGRCNDLEKALEIVERSQRKYRFELNAQVYTCLISACINCRKFEKAKEVFAKMRSQCVLDAKAYQTIISGCLKFREVKQAASYLHEALEVNDNNPVFLVGQDVINNVLHALGRRPSPEMAHTHAQLQKKLATLDRTTEYSGSTYSGSTKSRSSEDTVFGSPKSSEYMFSNENSFRNNGYRFSA